MITPLTPGGEIDYNCLERLVAHLLAGKVAGIFVLGSSGEGPWLTAPLRSQVVEHTVRVVAGRIPVLAGALEPSTSRTVEAVQLLADAGADAAVITSPFYYPADAAAQIRHVKIVTANSPIPIVLYNIPTSTHNPISPDTVKELVEIKNLVAVKDSAGMMPDFKQLLELQEGRPGFTVFQGAERLAAESLIAGAQGIVPGLANLVPELFSRLASCVGNGDAEMARSLQERVNRLWELHTHGFWLECLKYAASSLGLCNGIVYQRDASLAEPAKAAIRQVMQTYGS
jgi:4-hydroxy-tetrahydrodipicolinate synthase